MKMTRATFVRSAAGLAAAAAASQLSAEPEVEKPRPGERATVALAGFDSPASSSVIRRSVREAALLASDFSWLSRGDVVFIKPVINSGNPYPATTHPEAVAAMVELLKERGAGRVIVGDMSGVGSVRFSEKETKGSTRANMLSAGFAGPVSAAGAELHCFEEAGWNAFYGDMPHNGNSWKNPIMMPNILQEARHIILMPRCSRHVIAGSTLGMKAAVGYWRHDTRLEFHRDAATLHEKIAEANLVSTLKEKQRLILTVADRMLADMGPDQGHVHEPANGIVIASPSIVAHDMTSLSWLLLNRDELPDVRDGIIDNSEAVAKTANHVVTAWLGGMTSAVFSQSVAKTRMTRITHDRVLQHAWKLAGGAPVIRFMEANAGVQTAVRRQLSEMVSVTG